MKHACLCNSASGVLLELTLFDEKKIEKKRYIRGFGDDVEGTVTCKAHFIKHVLGLVYKDAIWDQEGWFTLHDGLGFDGGDVRNRLLDIGCIAVKKRKEAQAVGRKYAFEKICRECCTDINTRDRWHSCERILRPMIKAYKEVVANTLEDGCQKPRFNQNKVLKGKGKGNIAMYFLTDRGVQVISRNEKINNENASIMVLYTRSCYRCTPPEYPPRGQRTWTDKECLTRGQDMCADKVCFYREITVDVHENDETWGFSHTGKRSLVASTLTPQIRNRYPITSMLAPEMLKKFEDFKKNIGNS